MTDESYEGMFKPVQILLFFFEIISEDCTNHNGYISARGYCDAMRGRFSHW